MVTDVNWTYCGDHYAMCSCVCSVTQSRPTLCAPMDCVAHQAPLSVHGIFQARMLEWVAISFSRIINYNVVNEKYIAASQ